MSKTLCLWAALAAALTVSVSPARAEGGRYSTPPAARLSPDLASPWLLQLRRNPVPPGARRTVVLAPEPGLRRRTIILREPALRDVPVRVERRIERETVVRTVRTTREVAPRREFDPALEPQIVVYETSRRPGTIIIDTNARFLYLVMDGGQARRYGVGVGKPGFEWAGTHTVTRKSEWPDWRPPAQMIAREAKKGRHLPSYMAGGPENPLGARALYLGSSLYRIHGTNQPWTIGQAVSSGCIRMRNEDVVDLYERVGVGTTVQVI